MHYGHPPHQPSPEDLTVIWCTCGWLSKELTRPELKDLGLPWYCDDCGRQSLYYARFHPRERDHVNRVIPKRETNLTP